MTVFFGSGGIHSIAQKSDTSRLFDPLPPQSIILVATAIHHVLTEHKGGNGGDMTLKFEGRVMTGFPTYPECGSCI
jgi:hypothetical protein